MMDQKKTDMLKQADVDVQDALDRLMGSEALLERFMKKFLDDTTYSALRQAVTAGDAQKALAAAHTLKGMCGNLSMKTLEALFTRQVALFRDNRFAEAAAMMPEIETAYNQVVMVVRGCWL